MNAGSHSSRLGSRRMDRVYGNPDGRRFRGNATWAWCATYGAVTSMWFEPSPTFVGFQPYGASISAPCCNRA